MNLRRRLFPSIILVATLIGNFSSFVQSNAIGDFEREFDTFVDEKYDEEIDTVDLKEALGNINSLELRLVDEEEHNALNTSTFYHFLKDDFLTDCTFMVGPSGQVEEVRAHCLVLAAASPLLRELFKSNNSSSIIYRMPDLTGKELKHILQFVYSGESCNIDDFEQAEALFKHASFLGLGALKNVAMAYIFSSIEPTTVWRILQLANDTNDESLERAAWFIIERQTQKVIKDSAFNELSKDNILRLASRNGLKIDEFELYEAIVKWATVQAQNEAIEITPSNLRTIIGTQILKKVRFLDMTSAEFSRVYMGFKILSYDEILPIIFNINDQESVPLLETISNSTEHRRHSVAETFLTFKSYKSCNLANSEVINRDVVHFSPKGLVETDGETITAVKVQIPMSVASIQSCCSIKEQFDILVFDDVGTNVLRKSFIGFPTCNEEMLSCNGTGNSSENLIDVPLNDIQLHDGYFVQIEFHNNLREYPKLMPLDQTCKPQYITKYLGWSQGEQEVRDDTVRKCSINEFVYLTYY